MDNVRINIARMCKLDGESTLRAFADVVIGDSFLVKGMRIIMGKNGLFVGMPRELGKDGRWYDNVFPITKEAKDALKATLLSAYEVQ